MASSTFLIEQTAAQRITGDASAAFLVAIKQALNDANMILNEAYDWPWMEVRQATNLRAAYTTGLITLVNDTTDYVTTTGTWSTGWSPMRLRTAAGHDYLVTYNAGNSRWELDRDLVEAEAGVAYTLYQDTYPLLARLRSLYMGWSTEVTEYPCSLITPQEMQVYRSGPLFTSTPVSYLALVEVDTTNLAPQIMVFPIPSAVGTVHYRGYREVAALTADADTFAFPLHVLPVYRRLVRAMVLELKGQLDRSMQERGQYELDLQRLISKSAPAAGAQDAIRLGESHFHPKPPVSGSFGYDDGGYNT